MSMSPLFSYSSVSCDTSHAPKLATSEVSRGPGQLGVQLISHEPASSSDVLSAAFRRAGSNCHQMSRTSSERFSGVKNLPTTSSDASNFGLISEVAKIN